MSLRVWLPLTKDLRQQGLDNVAVTNNGATFNSAGKLGGCYEFASGKRIQTTLPLTSNLNSKAISFACWVNISSWNSSYDCLMSIADGTGWQQSRATLCRNNTASTLCWNIADGSTSTRVSTTTSLSTNTWYHIACTYDGTSLKIYLNGVLNNSAAATLSINYAGTFNIGGWSGNNYPLNAKLNDVRIYSHCLSPMEIKELAKGLVLHYSLNDKSIESTTNLNTKVNMNNSTNSIWGGHSTTTTTYDCTNEPVPFNSGNKIEITYPVGDSTGGGTSINLGVSIPVASSTVYTLSVYLKASDNFSYWTANFIYYYGDSSGHGIFNINNKEYIANGWYRIWGTLTTGSSQTSLNPYFYSYPGENRIYYIGGWQLEQKDHMTPFTSPGTSRDNYIIYDCSGFCNNGTKTGTFSWTSDTPKYQVSTKFSQSRIQCNGDFLYGLSTATLSAWVKLTAYHSERCMVIYANGRYLTINNSGQLSGYSYGKTPAGYYNSNQTIPLNTWTHITIVWDDTTWYFYINGTLVNSWACTGTFTNVGSYASVGQESNGGRSVSGLISDVRIYATALSADDVKSLYQNSAYIDSSGNVYGAVHSEV